MYNRAINFNHIKKKDNHELIRKSLIGFESSFRDLLPQNLITLENDEKQINTTTSSGAFGCKRLSASCVDYQTRRFQKKIDKKNEQLFTYRSQQTSIEREPVDGDINDPTKPDLANDSRRKFHNASSNIANNQIEGYKIQIPFREKKNLKSTLNLRQFNKTSNSFLSGMTKLNSSRKQWKKRQV